MVCPKDYLTTLKKFYRWADVDDTSRVQRDLLNTYIVHEESSKAWIVARFPRVAMLITLLVLSDENPLRWAFHRGTRTRKVEEKACMLHIQ